MKTIIRIPYKMFAFIEIQVSEEMDASAIDKAVVRAKAVIDKYGIFETKSYGSYNKGSYNAPVLDPDEKAKFRSGKDIFTKDRVHLTNAEYAIAKKINSKVWELDYKEIVPNKAQEKQEDIPWDIDL